MGRYREAEAHFRTAIRMAQAAASAQEDTALLVLGYENNLASCLEASSWPII